jgi:hypothetical protein
VTLGTKGSVDISRFSFGLCHNLSRGRIGPALVWSKATVRRDFGLVGDSFTCLHMYH